MSTSQWELSEGMFESRDFPKLLAMTLLTLWQGATVDIISGMARKALVTHS
jgi:hypothetical protein